MIWKFADNINTDFISPARQNLISNITENSDELRKLAFAEYRPEFPKNVKDGDILVAGENFGCGSSRETAAATLKVCGLSAIIAKSFARIFYRNAINIGLVCIVADTSNIDEADELEIDFDNNKIINKTKNFELGFESDGLTKRILAEGGLIAYINKNGLDSLEGLI